MSPAARRPRARPARARPVIRVALLCAALAAPARAETWAFCWIGAAGYTMEGTIGYPDGAEGTLTQDDVTAFAITGYRDGVPLGSWSLADRLPETTFVLRFDADALAFPMGGSRAAGTYQAWNADGMVEDCGNPGFGFNGGNRAQDVCVDGTFREESGVAPKTPLAVSPDPAVPCGPLPMS